MKRKKTEDEEELPLIKPYVSLVWCNDKNVRLRQLLDQYRKHNVVDKIGIDLVKERNLRRSMLITFSGSNENFTRHFKSFSDTRFGACAEEFYQFKGFKKVEANILLEDAIETDISQFECKELSISTRKIPNEFISLEKYKLTCEFLPILMNSIIDNWNLAWINFYTPIPDPLRDRLTKQLHQRGSCHVLHTGRYTFNAVNAMWRRRLGKVIALTLCFPTNHNSCLFFFMKLSPQWDARIFLYIAQFLHEPTCVDHNPPES